MDTGEERQQSCHKYRYSILGVYLYLHVGNAFFFVRWEVLVSRPTRYGLFSRSRLRGTGGPVCTLQRKFAPRPRFVARALAIQSRASWLFFNGIAFRDTAPSRDHGSPTISAFDVLLLYHTIPPALKLSTLRQPRGAIAVAHQTLPFS